MRQLSGLEILEFLEKSGSKEWNEALSGRLESVRSYLSQDEWTKGISPYLKAIMGKGMAKLLGENLSSEANSYTRGLLAGLMIAISLPGTVEAAISGEVAKKKSGPKGDAGY